MNLTLKEKVENKAKESADEFENLNPIAIAAINQIHPNLYLILAKYFFASGVEFAISQKLVPIEEL